MNLVLDFLSLFVPAFLGVAGTFYLYRRRQLNREESLRKSFLAELREVQILQEWPMEDRIVPTMRFASNAVYENNAGDIALLDGDEVEALVRYYNRLQITTDSINHHNDITSAATGDLTKTDSSSQSRENTIRTLVDKLELTRQRALMVLGDKTLPKNGDKLTQHQELQNKKAILCDFELVDGPANDLSINQKGEDFFRGKEVLSGEVRQNDVLGRDKSAFRQNWEKRLSSIRSILRQLFQ